MATSNEAKDTSKTDKKETEEKAEEAAAPKSSESTTNIIDGRIFEADSEQALSAEEKVEVQEFQMTLKKYNDLSRKMLKDALKQERNELNEAEKSPKMKYYEGTRTERIEVLDTETKLMDEMEQKKGQRA